MFVADHRIGRDFRLPRQRSNSNQLGFDQLFCLQIGTSLIDFGSFESGLTFRDCIVGQLHINMRAVVNWLRSPVTLIVTRSKSEAEAAF